MVLAWSCAGLWGKSWDFHVCFFAHHTICNNVYIALCVCLWERACVPICSLVYVYLHVGWGQGLLWTENIPPSHNLSDPAASLPKAIYFFSTHTAAPTPITQTHSHAPTAPVAPPRLLGEEQGDPGPAMGREGRWVGGGATRGKPALVQPSEALLVRVTDLRWHQH